jgi:hypothetical protein
MTRRIFHLVFLIPFLQGTEGFLFFTSGPRLGKLKIDIIYIHVFLELHFQRYLVIVSPKGMREGCLG